MPNTDISFNKRRLMALFLEKNNLINTIPVDDFDKHFDFEEPVDLGGGMQVLFTDTDNQSALIRNTSVRVIAKVGSPFFGRKKITYNRISVSDIPEIYIDVVDETNVYQLINKINDKYGLFLTEYDILNEAISGTGNIKIELAFKPTSLIFNDHIFVNLTIDGGDAQTSLEPDEVAGGGSANTE